MKLKIAILPGDGIGPEIMKQGVAVLDAVAQKCGHQFEYEEALVGACAIDAVGDPYPDATHDVCMRADAVLFAAVGDPKYDNDPTAKIRPETGLLAMRKKLGLFANVRPVATFDCLLHKSPLKEELLRGADFVVIRELTGGMYFGEKYQDNDRAYDTDVYTRPEIERILRVAFETAMARHRHLTVVDKANILASSRLWRQIAKEMEPQYPEVTTDYMFIDNASMRVLTEPRFFSPAPWGCSPPVRWASTRRSSSPSTAHGRRLPVRTLPTLWRRYFLPPCFSNTSASPVRAVSSAMPSMPRSPPTFAPLRSRSMVDQSTAPARSASG